MNPTSLHNILSRDSSPIRQDQLHYLFCQPRFPRFELRDLISNATLMQNSRFSFFMQILERWNNKVSGEKAEGNEIQYRKNEFIFSWLKGVAVQNSGNMDSSLNQLYEWYSSNMDNDIVCRVRCENVYRSRLEDWQIRNSYKSNMPLEINNYRRRVIFGDNNSTIPPLVSQNKPEKGKIENIYEISNSGRNKAKKQNNYIRGVREERQMGDYLTNYRKNKMSYFKNTTKNFYKKEFSRDKLPINHLKHLRSKIQSDQHVKSYRIKTGMGIRPFEKTTPNASFTQTAYSRFFKPNDVSTQGDASTLEAEGLFASPQKDMFASKIDGLGLLSNPFDIKQKKKKK